MKVNNEICENQGHGWWVDDAGFGFSSLRLCLTPNSNPLESWIRAPQSHARTPTMGLAGRTWPGRKRWPERRSRSRSRKPDFPGEEVARLNVFLPETLVRSIKAKAADSGKTLSQFVADWAKGL